MSAVYYLIVSCLFGFLLMKIFLPELFRLEGYKSLAGKPVMLAKWVIILPASFLIGTLLQTWGVYLTAYLFRNTGRPLFYGNIIILLIFSLIVALLLFKDIFQKKAAGYRKQLFGGTETLDAGLALISLAITSFMMILTFFVKGTTLNIGLSVFGDFGPHMAMIRSFSHGLNFPTEYPFYPDGTVRYHFMFQFLAGNLEYLGLRLDWAFNIPSILSYVSFILLLYALTVVITGKKTVGIFTCIFFFFRSGFAFFTYLKDLTAEPASLLSVLQKILLNDEFIGKTPNESWGLWNQNVFLNQRHLAFALGIMLVVILGIYPLFREMLARLADSRKTGSNGYGKIPLSEMNEGASPQMASDRGINESTREQAAEYTVNPKGIIQSFFCAETWIPRFICRPLFLGLLLGLLSFWNGAVVIAVLPVLFILAVMSVGRLEYLIIAVLTLGLSFLETQFFIGNGTQAVKPAVFIGFVAANKTFLGIVAYSIEMFGILPFVIVAAMSKAVKGMKWLCLAFITPILFAFTVQLTPDIAVNHKYIIISVLLLNIIAADFILRLYRIRKTRIMAMLLMALMVVTGVIDNITDFNMNNPSNVHGKRPFTLNLEDPLTVWVENNTQPNEVFLTNTYYIHPLLLSGRKIFLGWHYFSWSAGYNTLEREATAKQIFNAADQNSLIQLVKANRIAYIVIDDDLRNSEAYKVNEQLIADTFKLMYSQETNQTVIYKTGS